ncbi:hypothetical protein ACFFP0_23815 [Rhizobium puerariae]|uniref:Lipoprotein n=1 Tax=Rhizobium puerariae TaxID=1585791 RepID=A0ABV6AMP0_9HYPH
MKLATLIALALALAGLAGCQSVPAERKNNCACMWENFDPLPEGVTA